MSDSQWHFGGNKHNVRMLGSLTDMRSAVYPGNATQLYPRRKHENG